MRNAVWCLQRHSVDVIINPVCPGLVASSLGRAIAGRSTFMRFAVYVHLLLMGKSADYGARFYVKAALMEEEQHVSSKRLPGLCVRTDSDYQGEVYSVAF